MGVPVVEAPCEAEAQCAALVRAGKVFAAATEDMDALTFGSSVLLRHLTFSEARKMPVQEFHLDDFIDLCILLGCDYCGSIRGIGPKRAIELIRQHRSIEAVLKNIDTAKYPPPEDWNYERARELFIQPDIKDAKELEIGPKRAIELIRQHRSIEAVLKNIDTAKELFIEPEVKDANELEIGPKRGIELIRQHRSIEAVLKNMDNAKYSPPQDWSYERARE
ncbi:Flap endonuclease 1, partial [Operophtera brumata]